MGLGNDAPKQRLLQREELEPQDLDRGILIRMIVSEFEVPNTEKF